MEHVDDAPRPQIHVLCYICTSDIVTQPLAEVELLSLEHTSSVYPEVAVHASGNKHANSAVASCQHMKELRCRRHHPLHVWLSRVNGTSKQRSMVGLLKAQAKTTYSTCCLQVALLQALSVFSAATVASNSLYKTTTCRRQNR